MICLRCKDALICDWARSACSEGFEISNCLNFCEVSCYRYERIAKSDALLRLIYDYFTDNLYGVSKEEAHKAITKAIKNFGDD